MVQIYSFDIFDTLITRKTATAAGIFLIIQYQLRKAGRNDYPVNLIEDFYQIRIDAENEARQKSEFEETTFDDIYKEIQLRFKLTPAQIETLKKLEINTELEYSIGIQRNISRVIHLLESGKQVIFLSDMYLPSADIKKLLEKAELRLAGCPVYVSSEQKAAKRSGKLYARILTEFQLEAAQLLHYGDNRYSDFLVPKKMGIQTELFNYKAISEYEQIYFAEDRLYMQMVAGVSKNTRLQLLPAQSLERVGACYSGPLLYTYTEFVLQRVLDLNLKKIYFLSRDGHILFQIAKIINDKNKLNLDIQYLHVSRQVGYLASLFEITSKEGNWILEFMDNLNTLAARFDLNPANLMERLNRKLNEPVSEPNRTLTERQKRAICNLLIKDKNLNTLFLKKAEDFRTLFLDYMNQKKLFEDIPFAMVDIGWSGKMQDSIYKTLSSRKNNIQMHYFYFGMYNTGVQKFTQYTSGFNQKHYFLESPMQVRTHATFFEVITSTNHGTTISFKQNKDGEIIPVLGPYKASPNWNSAAYQNQILYFANEFQKISAGFPNMRSYGYEIAMAMKTQAEKPVKEMAETIGNYPFTMGHNEKEKETLAPRITFSQILHWSVNRKNEFANWVPGALQRSTYMVRTFYYILNTARMNIRRLKTGAIDSKQLIKEKMKAIINR